MWYSPGRQNILLGNSQDAQWENAIFNQGQCLKNDLLQYL
jgi:hypothetical protein